jgi:hypothetical protein
MAHEYAHTRANMISLIHSLQPQPVTKLISYKLEGIGSTGWPAFITPRSAVRSRPPLPTFLSISASRDKRQSAGLLTCDGIVTALISKPLRL